MNANKKFGGMRVRDAAKAAKADTSISTRTTVARAAPKEIEGTDERRRTGNVVLLAHSTVESIGQRRVEKHLDQNGTTSR